MPEQCEHDQPMPDPVWHGPQGFVQVVVRSHKPSGQFSMPIADLDDDFMDDETPY